MCVCAWVYVLCACAISGDVRILIKKVAMAVLEEEEEAVVVVTVLVVVAVEEVTVGLEEEEEAVVVVVEEVTMSLCMHTPVGALRCPGYVGGWW